MDYGLVYIFADGQDDEHKGHFLARPLVDKLEDEFINDLRNGMKELEGE